MLSAFFCFVLSIMALGLIRPSPALASGTAPESAVPAGEPPEPEKMFQEDGREVYNLRVVEKVGRVKLSWELNDQLVDHIEIWGKYLNDRHYWRYDGFHRMTRSVELHLDPLARVELNVQLVFRGGARSRGRVVQATARHSNVVFDDVEGRTLLIYLPEGYHEETREYPVIYMHDGQNLFSPRLAYIEEWRIDRAVERLVKEGKFEKTIVVGIYNSSKRAEEYTPFADKRFGGGKAREFTRFVVEKIMPYVETKYRISSKKEDRAVMGSSFGGILSLWMGYTYPHVFSVVGAISPSLWIADGAMLRELEDQPKKDIKIWIDQGTGEWSDFTRNAVSILINKGYKYGTELAYYEVKDAVHHERAWSERIDCPFILFKGKPSSQLLKMRLDVQQFRQFSVGPNQFVINPIGFFDNGMWYSLYASASFSIEGKSPAVIDETGVLQFNNAPEAKVIVRHSGKEESVLVRNPDYKPPAKPKREKKRDGAALLLKKPEAPGSGTKNPAGDLPAPGEGKIEKKAPGEAVPPLSPAQAEEKPDGPLS
jgi:predicted alpha/beta superfamily hydrolase